VDGIHGEGGVRVFSSAPEIYPFIPPDLDTDVSSTDEESCDIFTPRKSHDLRRQVYDIGRKVGGLHSDIMTLTAKTGKSLDNYPAEITHLKAENSRLRAELDRHKPDKRQTVHWDTNKVFVDLPKVQSAEDMRQKRLRSFTASEQLTMNSFIEKCTPPKKRARK
jgi:hypothetical protein